ncbi:MAG: DNA polymerase III subunit chi [Pseudomonadota bacterium]
MTEVLFYHLERRSLEDVLPELLEKCVQRGWRAVVQASTPDRCAVLDAHLWTYRDESFLPHGTGSDVHASEQPVWLTTDADNPNGASVRFLVERAVPDTLDGYERIVHIFDGGDPDALAQARSQWTEAKSGGHTVTYWQQDEQGRWNKKGT